MQSEISPAKGLNMKLVPSLLVFAIAAGVVPDAAAGQKARPDPVASRVDIETTSNLLAATEELPIMLAAAPSLTATDAGAASASVPATTQQTKYEAVYRMCGYMHSADQVPYNIERDNHVSPASAVDGYFYKLNGKLPNFASGEGEPEPIQVKVLKAPAHGVLVPATKAAIYFIYHANSGYLGSDQMVFEVETMGKKFKVIQTVIIDDSGNLDYPTPETVKTGDEVCPDDKGSSLDIIELPTEGFASAEH